MTCGNCGSHIGQDEHRCRRCGRRPGDTLTRDESLVTNGALAARLQPLEQQSAAVAEAPGAEALARATQRGLFQDNVIQFPPPVPQRRKPAQPGSRPATAARSQARRTSPGQATLDFLPSNPKPRTLSTTVESKIYCEAPVAALLHRAVAAALDWSMVALGWGLLLAVYFIAGGRIALTQPNLIVLAGTLVVAGFAYGAIWVIAGSETAGMQWTRLRLITFEGSRPERNERIFRFAGSCLSVCSVLGLLWPWSDEETLGWQDHISGTFLTPIEFERQVFRRG